VISGSHKSRYAAVLLVLGLVVAMATAPAQAAGAWRTLHQTPRHVKAQACKEWFGKSAGASAEKWIDTRGDTRGASTGARFDVTYDLDGLKVHYGWMKPVPRGVVKRQAGQWEPRDKTIRVKMRIRTAYGTSGWSRWYSFKELPTCP